PRGRPTERVAPGVEVPLGADDLCGGEVQLQLVQPEQGADRGGSAEQSFGHGHSSSRSESPINHKVGGHSPMNSARRSALPRSSWPTLLARSHRPMHSAIPSSEPKWRWVLRRPALCSSFTRSEEHTSELQSRENL